MYYYLWKAINNELRAQKVSNDTASEGCAKKKVGEGWE
jgi:hypothetical protein